MANEDITNPLPIAVSDGSASVNPGDADNRAVRINIVANDPGMGMLFGSGAPSTPPFVTDPLPYSFSDGSTTVNPGDASNRAIRVNVVAGSAGVSDHALLSHLDFASAGHTGFAQTGGNTFTGAQAINPATNTTVPLTITAHASQTSNTNCLTITGINSGSATINRSGHMTLNGASNGGTPLTVKASGTTGIAVSIKNSSNVQIVGITENGFTVTNTPAAFNSANGTVPLAASIDPGQTQDIFQLYDQTAGGVAVNVSADGSMNLTANDTTVVPLKINASLANANVIEVRDGSNALVLSVDKNGNYSGKTISIDGTGAAGTVTLRVYASSSQTANIFQVNDSSRNECLRIEPDGQLYTNNTIHANAIDASAYASNGNSGVTGNFTSQDGKSITVTNGLITSIL